MSFGLAPLGSTALGLAPASAPTGVAGSASLVGVAAAASAGNLTPAGTASTTVTGVTGTCGAGVMTATGGASKSITGVNATSATGTITATAGGGAAAAVAGVAGAAAAGTLTPGGGASTTFTGVAATSASAALFASGGASATLADAATFSEVGMIIASIVNNDAAVTLLGVASIARAGAIAALGTRAGIAVDITEDMICKVVRDYILSIAPTLRVLRTPVNKASMPQGAYVAFTPGMRRPLATNESTFSDNGRFVKRSEQMTFQIDCYGAGAVDLAETLTTLYRDKYAVDMFADSGLSIAPLYAGDVMQAPFKNDEDQYEDRYTFEIELQINPITAVPQQSCNMLGIDIVSVDANYPPQEVE